MPVKKCITKKYNLFLDERFEKWIRVKVMEFIGNTGYYSLIFRNTPHYLSTELVLTNLNPPRKEKWMSLFCIIGLDFAALTAP
jgi:hypothetical protein